MREEMEELQTKIKDYMIHSHVLELQTSSKLLAATITHAVRRTIDKKLLVEAGIDPERFIKTTEYDTFTLKEVKNAE